MLQIILGFIVLLSLSSCDFFIQNKENIKNENIKEEVLQKEKKIDKLEKEKLEKIEKQKEIDKLEKEKVKEDEYLKKNLKGNKYFLLKPYKNSLFKYQGGILKSEFEGDIKLIDYSVHRDIEQRDIIDVVKVNKKYITEIEEKNKKLKTYKSENGEKKYWVIKNNDLKNDDIKIIVIYFYGLNGNIGQGINNESFGGNFNRIQNLMIKNNGIYISTEFTNFQDKGVKDITVLLNDLKEKYKNADIILSGASSGGTLVWNILKEKKLKNIIKGVILMGSVVDNNYLLDKDLIPIYIGHGTKDRNLPYMEKYQFYNNIKRKNIKYPIKIEFFKGGLHGTPLRMMDWYKTINWILKTNYNNKNI